MKPENIKLTIELLGAISSLLAIVVVFTAWAKNLQVALKIERIVIHRKENEDTYILIVRNRKPYPVKIKALRCFTHKEFLVEQKKGFPPEYTESLSYENSPFTSNVVKEIEASGDTDIRYTSNSSDKIFNSLIFNIESSHGRYNLKCKNIDYIEMGNVQTYKIDYSEKFNSKLWAVLVHDWLKTKNKYILWFRKLTNR